MTVGKGSKARPCAADVHMPDFEGKTYCHIHHPLGAYQQQPAKRAGKGSETTSPPTPALSYAASGVVGIVSDMADALLAVIEAHHQIPAGPHTEPQWLAMVRAAASRAGII